MKNILLRGILGLVYVTLIIGAIWLSPAVYFVVFLGFGLVCASELSRIVYKITGESPRVVLICTQIIATSIAFLSFSGIIELKWLTLLVVMLILAMLSFIFTTQGSFVQRLGILMFSVIYLLIPFSLIYVLLFPTPGAANYTPVIPTAVFIFIWVNDTFAYIFGLLFGKHKLFERITPKKTWEGFFGGILSTLASALTINAYFHKLSIVHWLAIALITALFGVLGDLFESTLKRQAGIKDSGNIMPGHGGLLDRLDSALFAVPAVVIYLLLFVN